MGWAILLGRVPPLFPTMEAGRGRALRGAAAWAGPAFRGWGRPAEHGMEWRLTEEERGVDGLEAEEWGPCWTVGLT